MISQEGQKLQIECGVMREAVQPLQSLTAAKPHRAVWGRQAAGWDSQDGWNQPLQELMCYISLQWLQRTKAAQSTGSLQLQAATEGSQVLRAGGPSAAESASTG